MKIIVFLSFVAVFHVSAETHAQRISLSENNVTIKKVFTVIKKQTGYNFVYDGKLVNDAKLVDIHVKDALFTEVLDMCLDGQHLTYEILNNTIVVKAKSRFLSVIENDDNEEHRQQQVAGRVLNTLGEPLMGVSVLLKGTNTGTSTDGNGNYSMNVPEQAILVFSYVGYVVQEVQVNSRSVVDVQLVEQSTALSDIVVTALGIKRERKSLGYSVTAVKGDRKSVV